MEQQTERISQSRRDAVILFIASASVFFEALDIAIVNLVMPLIEQKFRLAVSQVQWLQTLYVLFYGGLLVLGGRLADTVGRKRVFLTASGLFLLTSLGAGLSPSFGWLLAFRSVQGVAAALLMPSALSIVTNVFRQPAARSRAIGVVSAFAAVGSGCGLSVGGLIAHAFGWQWVFFINVPVIGLTFLLALGYIPDQVTAQSRSADSHSSRTRPDILSGLLLTFLITAFSYQVHRLGNWRLQPGLHLLIGLGMIGGSVWFFHRNAVRSEPLVDFQVLRPVWTSVGAYACLGASFTGFLFLVSLMLQHDQGMDPSRAGLLLFPFSVLSAITGKVFLPFLARRFHMRRIALLGMGALTAGAVLLWCHIRLGPFSHSQFSHSPFSRVWLVLSMACANGLGIALAYSGLTVLAVQKVRERHHGLVSGVATSAYFFGGGLGLSLLSLLTGSTQAGGPVVGTGALVLLGAFGGAGTVWLLVGKPERQV